MTPQERLAILLAAAEALRANPFRVEAEGCGCCYSAEPRTFTHEGSRYSASFTYDNHDGTCEAFISRSPRRSYADYVGALTACPSEGTPGEICSLPLPQLPR